MDGAFGFLFLGGKEYYTKRLGHIYYIKTIR